MVKEYIEIERRWLLRYLPSRKILEAIDVKQTVLTTVYIFSDQNLELRIRRRSKHGETTYSVVTKIGSGLVRPESPKLSANAELFDYYLKTKHKPYLIKKLWKIPLKSGLKLSISRFNQTKLKGLILAEIEFESEKAANSFSDNDFPIWFKPLMIKEVTEDPRYNGKNLTIHSKQDPK